MSFTFKTSCKEDILPNGLGDFGNEGGAADGRCGAARFAPTQTHTGKEINMMGMIQPNRWHNNRESMVTHTYHCMVVKWAAVRHVELPVALMWKLFGSDRPFQ